MNTIKAEMLHAYEAYAKQMQKMARDIYNMKEIVDEMYETTDPHRKSDLYLDFFGKYNEVVASIRTGKAINGYF